MQNKLINCRLLYSEYSNATQTDNAPKVWETAQKYDYFLLVLFYCIPKIINQTFSDKFWCVRWKLSLYQVAFYENKNWTNDSGKNVFKNRSIPIANGIKDDASRIKMFGAIAMKQVEMLIVGQIICMISTSHRFNCVIKM